MKKLLFCGLIGMAALLLPACETEHQEVTTTTTEETVVHPAVGRTTTTTQARTPAY